MLAVCIVIVAVIRLLQGWRTQFADGNADDWYRPDLWPGFKAWHFAAVFPARPRAGLSLDLRSALRLVDVRHHRGATPHLQRQHHDRDRGPHLHEFLAVLAVPGAPGLVSVRQGRRRQDLGRRLPRQSPDPVAGADRAAGLPARLDRDAAGGRVSGAGVLSSGLISPGRCCRGRSASSIITCRPQPPRASCWSMRCVAATRRAGCYGPLSASVQRVSPRCCRSRPRSSRRRWRRSTA